jgi:hypothetical protein
VVSVDEGLAFIKANNLYTQVAGVTTQPNVGFGFARCSVSAQMAQGPR